MNSDKIVIGAVSAVTIAIFGFIIYSAFSNEQAAVTGAQPENVLGNNPHVKGAKENAKVTLVEFSDFECPACQTAFPYVSSIATKYASEVAVVYRHFPLPSHKSAIPAAKAAEAAHLQGKFWEFHDELFNNPGSFTLDDMVVYATRLGLDVEKFKSDINSSEVSNAVNEDLQMANTLKLSGTPTFFLIYNGKTEQIKLNKFEDIETAVQRALSEVNGGNTSQPTEEPQAQTSIEPTITEIVEVSATPSVSPEPTTVN